MWMEYSWTYTLLQLRYVESHLFTYTREACLFLQLASNFTKTQHSLPEHILFLRYQNLRPEVFLPFHLSPILDIQRENGQLSRTQSSPQHHPSHHRP